MQAPVDVPSGAAKNAAKFSMSYGTSRITVHHHENVADLVDNGHTIQVDIHDGGSLQTAKDTYVLKQFHFHTPSENKLDGKQFPMEAHFVHQSAAGNFAVVAVFFEEGGANGNLQKVIEHFPPAKGESVEPGDDMDISLHLPASSESFHFLGSFTTPPCTENVEWIVLKSPKSAGQAQIAAFAERLGHNNRPIQDWADRAVSSNALEASGN